MPDCYFVIQTDGETTAAPGGKGVRKVHADLKKCASDHDGDLNKFAHDKRRKKVDSHIGYATEAEAKAALPNLEACLEEKGHTLLDSGIAETAEELGL